MNTRCPRCGAAMPSVNRNCPRCGWLPPTPPIDAIVLDEYSPAAREQGLDTLYIGLGLLCLGSLVFVGGLAGLLLPVTNDGFNTVSFDFFIVGMAAVAGLSIALFIAASIVFAASRGPASARAGGVAGAVVGSVLSGIVSVLVIVIVVIVVICVTILALVVSLMNACGCKVNTARLHSPPPVASGFVDGLD